MPKLVRNQLTKRGVDSAPPGKHADGGGLYLVVSKASGKSWVWRGTIHGKRRELGIGSANPDAKGNPLVSLKDARDIAWTYNRWAAEGRDPAIERRQAVAEVLTFEAATRKAWETQIKPQVKTAKQATLWFNMMKTYTFPTLGKMALADIRQTDVKAVLAPIWQTKEETARRVRQRITTVFNWARTEGVYEGVPPTDGIEAGLPRQSGKVTHRKALPYSEAPALFRKLDGAGGVGAMAVRFLMLTASRPGSVRLARWETIDLKKAVWSVPPEADKMARGFDVPLSKAAVDVLGMARGLSDDLVFPGARAGKPMSDMTLTKALRTIDCPYDVHGLRSTFRTWAEEKTEYRHEIKEAALGHKIPSAVERAYNRAELMQHRRALMDDWAAFCEGKK